MPEWFSYNPAAGVRFPTEGSEWALLIMPFRIQAFDIPLPAERNVKYKSLIKRCTSSQSLGIFRLQVGAFLLCYDSKCTWSSFNLCVSLCSSSEFGVYIDKHGTLINGRVVIEWEGIAERVSYHHPYILLFSSNFVEVRHAASGQLEQIIRGNSMRCIWDGYQDGDRTAVQFSHGFGVIGVTHASSALDELAVQRIFTLVPSKHSLSPTKTQTPSSTAECAGARL